MDHEKVNSFLFNAKNDGVFASLLQETLERVYITNLRKSGQSTALRDTTGKPVKDIGFLGVDVSHSKEATYIYQRILSRNSFPYQFMIVDIGANDGFLSSNSFNFIQWGWDAVLVDPQPAELNTAKRNVHRYEF